MIPKMIIKTLIILNPPHCLYIARVYKTSVKESTRIRRWNIFRIRFRLRLRGNEKTVAPPFIGGERGWNLYLLHLSEFGDLEAVKGSKQSQPGSINIDIRSSFSDPLFCPLFCNPSPYDINLFRTFHSVG